MRELRIPRRSGHLVRPRALRASAAAIAAITLALLLGPAPAAFADDATLPAEDRAWFWSSNSKITTCTGSGGGVIPDANRSCGALSVDDGANATGVGATPPGVAAPISTGHIGVSLKNGSSDMRGYLKFGLSSVTAKLPLGTRPKFESFVVVLTAALPTDTEHAQQHTEFEQGKAPGTSNERSASILACAATVAWGTAEGDPVASTTILPPDPATDPPRDEPEITTTRDEPLYDCGHQALGVATPDFRGWRFDITNIANKWASGELQNNGIALTPVNTNLSSTWTVEFHGPALEIRDNEDEVTVVDDEHAARAEVRFEGVPLDTTPTTGGAGPPGPPGPAGPTVIPPVTDAPVDPGSGDGGGGVVPLVPVARSGAPTTPGWLYLLIPLGLMGLALTSRAIGPEGAAVGSDNRVARILQARRLDEGAPEGEMRSSL